MAVVKYGEYITAMSGSVGGTTHARNRFGFYVRNRTKPVNPNTGRQQAVRSALTQMTTRWSQTLTQAQRDAWKLYADSVVMKNALGEAIYLTGFNHYLRSNIPLVVIAATIVDDGPTIFELPEADPTYAVTGTEAAQTLSLAYNAALAWATETGGYMYHYQGSPQNAQRTFFAGPWRLLGMTTGVDAAPPASPDILSVQFAIAQGQRQWAYARIQRTDGRLSEPFRADTLVGA